MVDGRQSHAGASCGDGWSPVRRPLLDFLVECAARCAVVLMVCAWGFLLSAPLLGQEPAAGVSWFAWDKGRSVAPLAADVREARFRFGLLLDGGQELFEDIAWGGDLPFLQATFFDGSRLSASGRGVMTARFDMVSESFNLQNVDFIGGLALGYARAAWAVELLTVHQSSHLGDELMETGERKRVDFGLEKLRLLADWRPVEGFRLYGGGTVVMHAWPASYTGRTTLQAGAEWEHRIWVLPWFAAVDATVVASEPTFGSVAVQTGVGLGNPPVGLARQRLFLEFYHGTSPMGQFYRDVETYGLVGVSYEFR